MQGQSLEAAAAADPFAAVWATEIEPFLRRDEGSELQAIALMDELCRRHPGEFEPAGGVPANGAGTDQGLWVTVALNELTAIPCPPFQISKPNSMSIMNQARWS